MVSPWAKATRMYVKARVSAVQKDSRKKKFADLEVDQNILSARSDGLSRVTGEIEVVGRTPGVAGKYEREALHKQGPHHDQVCRGPQELLCSSVRNEAQARASLCANTMQ